MQVFWKCFMYVKYEEVFMNYYDKIKEELINNEVYKRVKDYGKNWNDLNTYYKVGKMLSEAGKYSKKLTIELGKGYTFTSLTRMKKFYVIIENLRQCRNN